jgi:hypothetical protein
LIDSMGAHGRDEDPITVLRVLRRTVLTVMLAFVVIGVSLLAVGLAQGDMRMWNLGCTTLILSIVGGGIVIAVLYCAELGMRSIQQAREEGQETQAEVRENTARLNALEATERAIADAIRPDDDGDDDELGRRRRG